MCQEFISYDWYQKITWESDFQKLMHVAYYSGYRTYASIYESTGLFNREFICNSKTAKVGNSLE